MHESFLTLQDFCASQSKDYSSQFLDITNRILFVREKLFMRFQGDSISFSAALHHFIQLFGIINIMSYTEKIMNDFMGVLENMIGKDVQPFVNPFNSSNKPAGVATNLLMVFYPLHYVLKVSGHLNELCNHVIDEVDDSSIIGSLVQKFSEQESKADYALKSQQYLASSNIIQMLEVTSIL